MSNKIEVNLLFVPQEPHTDTHRINGQEVIISAVLPYDEIINQVLLAANILINSGDKYVYPFNEKMIADLCFIKCFTNINLDFLEAADIKMSDIAESYDILAPILELTQAAVSDTQRQFYYDNVVKTIRRENTYRNSARGIVDALSEHNILQQETMLEQLQAADSDKLNTIVDFMAAYQRDEGAEGTGQSNQKEEKEVIIQKQPVIGEEEAAEKE